MTIRFGIGVAAVALAAQAQTAGGWQTIRDKRGASIEVPAGWKAAVEANSTRINVSGPGGERMVVWPVFLGETLNAQTASAMLPRVAQKLDAAMAWLGAAAPAGTAAVRIAGRANGQAAVCSVTWVNSARGAAAYFVLSAAPQAQYAATAPTFARVFASVRLAPPNRKMANCLRWNDPREQAFSMEFPADWRVEGGTARRAAVDVVQTWSATSADGSARVTGGDAEIPTFTLPNQMLAFAGFREGSWYSPGYGVRMLVKSYMPGAMFAQWYAQSKAAQGCANLRFTQQQDRTREFGAINAQYAQFRAQGMNVQLSAGEVSFTCERAGRPVNGYYFATTLLTTQMGNNGIWVVDQLYGYMSSPGSEDEAEETLSRGLQSFQWNPQWLRMQQGLAMQVSGIVSQTQTEIAKMSKASFEYRQRSGSESMRKWSNAMLGLLDARDPATGRELKVDNAANYTWIDVNGKITGTLTDTKPAGIDPRMLVTLP